MQQRRKFAVAGGTGRVGRHVVEILRERGHDAVAISRATGVDLVAGAGLDEALAGVECVIEAASGPSPEQKPATDFFMAETRNLQGAAARAGVRRMVVVSIIGCDRFSGGYLAAKVAHERAMLAGPVPVRIRRAAQFHEFISQFVEWGTQGDVSYLPVMRTQLVSVRTVAQALVNLATDPEWAAGKPSPARIPEIAGPREEILADAAKLLVARRGERLRIEEVSDPADPDGALYAAGVLLPGPDAILAGPAFEDWLRAEVPAAQGSPA